MKSFFSRNVKTAGVPDAQQLLFHVDPLSFAIKGFCKGYTLAKEENQISNKGCKNMRFGMRTLEHSFKILISTETCSVLMNRI